MSKEQDAKNQSSDFFVHGVALALALPRAGEGDKILLFKTSEIDSSRATNSITLGSKPRGSEFVDCKSTLIAVIPGLRHPGENRGPFPSPLTWIPFSNGMTDAVRHLDAGGSLS
jgi:hypothetical protein